ncbi:MAG: CaiB/BaiF CoA transferase family protein [Candidatus Binatia bacterium]
MVKREGRETIAPLEGIRVVEIASFVAAPAAGTLLADLGADVIKVEVPRGEMYRYARPRLEGIKHEFPEAPHFHMDNRGKRSIALDLMRLAARRALMRVIDGADIVLTNMLPARLEKYGLDPGTLRCCKPALIIAMVDGYGLQGDEAGKPAFDYAAYWARTGFMDHMHEPDGPPAFQRPAIGDHAAALSLVTGILSALRMRDRSGEGQVVHVSLMHMGFYILGSDTALTLATKQAPPRHDRRRPRNPLWNQYAVKGGRWIFLVMIESDRYWPRFCAAIERPDLLEDPRFDGAVSRYRNSEELVKILSDVFARRTLEEWEAAFHSHAIIWAPVRTLEEAIEDPQARAMGIFQTMHHPDAGDFETVGPPLRLSAYEMRAGRPAPALGAHAAQILAEAGLAEQEIRDALSDTEVTASG